MVEEITAALGLTLSDLFYNGRMAQRERRPAQLQPWRFGWRRVSADFQHHAEGLWLRAETVMMAASDMNVTEWTDGDFDNAVRAVSRAYEELERAELLADVAFGLRVRGIREEKERDESRRSAA